MNHNQESAKNLQLFPLLNFFQLNFFRYLILLSTLLVMTLGKTFLDDKYIQILNNLRVNE